MHMYAQIMYLYAYVPSVAGIYARSHTHTHTHRQTDDRHRLTYICTHTHIRIGCMHLNVHMCIHVMHAYACIHVHVYVYVCAYECMCIDADQSGRRLDVARRRRHHQESCASEHPIKRGIHTHIRTYAHTYTYACEHI
jgi:hypothetical protein